MVYLAELCIPGLPHDKAARNDGTHAIMGVYNDKINPATCAG